MEYKTKIESVDYLDMGDSKNSWYVDATRFDPNFPLAMTYITSDFLPLKSYWREQLLTDKVAVLGIEEMRTYHESINFYNHRVYSVLNSSVEFYRKNKKLSMILVEGFVPNLYFGRHIEPGSLTFPYQDSYTDVLIKQNLAAYCGRIPNIHFMVRNWNNIEGVFYGTLLICAELEPEALSKIYNEAYGYYYTFKGVLATQLIVTKDWDLVKRYLFFMIRNHQYENFQVDYSDCIYDCLPEGCPLDTDEFDRLSGSSIVLPYDVRNGKFDIMGWRKYFFMYDRGKWRAELEEQKRISDKLSKGEKES